MEKHGPGNHVEQKVSQALRTEGWQVFHKGLPDFLCVKGDRMKWVEVKSIGDSLSQAQMDVIQVLRRLGFEVEVRAMELTILEERILVYMAQRSGRPARAKTISNQMRCDPRPVSQSVRTALNQLHRAGLLSTVKYEHIGHLQGVRALYGLTRLGQQRADVLILADQHAQQEATQLQDKAVALIGQATNGVTQAQLGTSLVLNSRETSRLLNLLSNVIVKERLLYHSRWTFRLSLKR